MNPVALREKLLVFLSEADRNIEAGGEEVNVQKEAEA
jgi:chemotaxis protein MotA